jgi:hypothetical protein
VLLLGLPSVLLLGLPSGLFEIKPSHRFRMVGYCHPKALFFPWAPHLMAICSTMKIRYNDG